MPKVRSMTKKIYFEPAGRVHSSQWDLINYPPEGYEFVTHKSIVDKTLVASDFFFFKHRRALEWLLPLNLTKAWVERFSRRIPGDIDLLCTYNLLNFRKKPWVVQVEWGAGVLIGYHKRHFKRFKGLVERSLASDRCKAILVWTELAKECLLSTLDCSGFESKIEVVPQAVHKRDFTKNYNDEKVRLLFVGSANVTGRLESKGGEEALEAFSILDRKFDNLGFVLRANIPDHMKQRYSAILSKGNVKIIEGILPWEQLEQEFMEADVFLYPTHEAHNTVILDAMSYELPIITTEAGSTGRIKDRIAGFVVKSPRKVPYFLFAGDSDAAAYGRAIQVAKPEMIKELVEKASILIENPELRRRMGKAARWEVEDGGFCINKRNEKLKRIFDRAML